MYNVNFHFPSFIHTLLHDSHTLYIHAPGALSHFANRMYCINFMFKNSLFINTEFIVHNWNII